MTTPTVLALDVDGVLTDGRVLLGASSEQNKSLSFRDLDALTRARRAGLTLALITGEQGPLVDAIAARTGIEITIQAAKDKLVALTELAQRLNTPLSDICYVGDAARDAPALAVAGLGLAPADACSEAKRAADCVLINRGGFGAVEEAVGICLRMANSDATDLTEQFARIADSSLAVQTRLRQESLPTLARVARVLIETFGARRKVLLCGNGGSAADAQHVAGELVGRFAKERPPWGAIALTTDSSVLTAIANDWAFEEVFARQVRALANPGDVVVGITTSGKSPNILRALEAAAELGATRIGFTGQPGGLLEQYSDVCFKAPSSSTPRIQEAHLLAWHSICEVVEAELTKLPGLGQ